MIFKEKTWALDEINIFINRFPPLVALKALVRPLRHLLEEVQLGRLPARNGQLKDKYAGGRCFILGTGVSLLDIPLAALANHTTFVCNQAAQHPDFRQLRPKFYVVSEPCYGKFLGEKYYQDTQFYFKSLHEGCENLDVTFFFHGTMKKFLKENGFLQDKEIYYILSRGSFIRDGCCRIELDRRINTALGALYATISIALYMGFKEIYLLGCGYTYTPPQVYHFYAYPDIARSLLPDQRQKAVADFLAQHPDAQLMSLHENGDRIRLDTAYKETPPGFHDGHRMIDNFAKTYGATIFNVVPDGYQSHVYQQISWNDVQKRLM